MSVDEIRTKLEAEIAELKVKLAKFDLPGATSQMSWRKDGVSSAPIDGRAVRIADLRRQIEERERLLASVGNSTSLMRLYTLGPVAGGQGPFAEAIAVNETAARHQVQLINKERDWSDVQNIYCSRATLDVQSAPASVKIYRHFRDLPPTRPPRTSN